MALINPINPNQLQPNSINPRTFDLNTTSSLFNQGTVNSNQMQNQASLDPLTGQYIDPTIGQGVNPDTVNPVPPPVGVQQNTMSPYEINNKQL